MLNRSIEIPDQVIPIEQISWKSVQLPAIPGLVIEYSDKLEIVSNESAPVVQINFKESGEGFQFILSLLQT